MTHKHGVGTQDDFVSLILYDEKYQKMLRTECVECGLKSESAIMRLMDEPKCYECRDDEPIPN